MITVGVCVCWCVCVCVGGLPSIQSLSGVWFSFFVQQLFFVVCVCVNWKVGVLGSAFSQHQVTWPWWIFIVMVGVRCVMNCACMGVGLACSLHELAVQYILSNSSQVLWIWCPLQGWGGSGHPNFGGNIARFSIFFPVSPSEGCNVHLFQFLVHWCLSWIICGGWVGSRGFYSSHCFYFSVKLFLLAYQVHFAFWLCCFEIVDICDLITPIKR